MSGSGDFISREEAEKVFSQPVTMSMCLTTEECRQKNAQRQIDLFVISGLPAADAIEKLGAYVRQIEELRKDGYYLQKTKMMTDGQATMTMPLPEPPKEDV